MKKYTGFTPLEMLVKRMKTKKISLGYCDRMVNGTQNRRGRFLSLTGFTLMELMIVIAIIMILSGAIVARIGTGSNKAKIAKAKAEMEQIASAMRGFYADTGYWVSCYGYGGFGGFVNPNDCGLIGLIKNNGDYIISPNEGNPNIVDIVNSRWKGPYLEATTWPKDPWGYRYYMIKYFVNSKVLAVLSCGPDGYYNSKVYTNPERTSIDYGAYTSTVGDDLVTIVHITE